MANEITLSRIHPDYSQIRAQLQLTLASLDTWKDLLPTATGQALIDFVAAVGDLDQYSIEHSYKEAFLDARKDSSIYAIAKLLGVRLSRKTPASATVNLSRTITTGTLTIPAYTEFSAQGTPLFNREPIVMNIGVTSIAVQLHEGTVKNINTLSDGSDFQLFISVEKEFYISDLDVAVFAGSLPIPVTTDGLWNSLNTNSIQDLTYNKGELVLLFGNTEYGYKPPVNTTLTFRYVVTAGKDGNDSSFSGKTVNTSAFSQIKGIVTTGLTGGANERSASFYKRFGPQLFSASNRATTSDEYKAVAIAYPSVVDALVIGQRKLSPSDLRYMNLVRVSLLTNSTWGTPQFDAFTSYYEDRTMFPVRFFFENPVAKPVDVSANVYCRLEGDLTEIQVQVEEAITELFSPREGIIGLNFFKSDVYEAIRRANTNIEFVELITPTTDVYPMFEAPKPPKLTEIPSSGILTPGLTSYALTVMAPSGETLADNVGTVNVVGNFSAVRVDWQPVPGAVGYRLYGRTFPHAKLIANLAPNVTSFTDTGTLNSVISPPALSTSGAAYCQLGTLSLNMFYTSRRIE